MGGNKTPTRRGFACEDLDLSLQDIVDYVEDEILVINSEYQVMFARLATQGRFPKEIQSPVGRICYEVFHNRNKPCGAPLWDCPLKKVLESGNTTTVIHPIHDLGTNKYLKISAYPVKDTHGSLRAIIELRRDVTAERELEAQLLRRHHQLLTLSHISSAVQGLRDLYSILRIALDNVLEIINGAVGGILLLDEDAKTLSYRVHRGLSAKYAEEMRMSLGEGIAGRVAQNGEAILLEDLSRDTRVAHLDLVNAEGIKGFVSIPLKAKDRVMGVMNVASHEVGRFSADDVSLLNSIGDYLGSAIEQVKLYERLAGAGERYRALLQHALTAQEQERKRIARELHDETSQSLTSLTLNLQALIQMAEMQGIGDADFMARLKTAHANAVHAGEETVRLMKELRPTLLDELGLPAAINRYAKDSLEAHGINVATKFSGLTERLPMEVEVTFFRIAQGLIGNILEHSGAKNVSIELECTAGGCALRIEDDGKGFDVSKLTQVDTSGRGAGVFTMKERARLVGGQCRIDSRPRKGTRVTVNIPLLRNIADEEDSSTSG